MNTPYIELVVDHEGKVTLQTHGFAGTTCREASAALERALGLVQQDRPTAEMYLDQSQQQHNPQRS